MPLYLKGVVPKKTQRFKSLLSKLSKPVFPRLLLENSIANLISSGRQIIRLHWNAIVSFDNNLNHSEYLPLSLDAWLADLFWGFAVHYDFQSQFA